MDLVRDTSVADFSVEMRHYGVKDSCCYKHVALGFCPVAELWDAGISVKSMWVRLIYSVATWLTCSGIWICDFMVWFWSYNDDKDPVLHLGQLRVLRWWRVEDFSSDRSWVRKMGSNAWVGLGGVDCQMIPRRGTAAAHREGSYDPICDNQLTFNQCKPNFHPSIHFLRTTT